MTMKKRIKMLAVYTAAAMCCVSAAGTVNAAGARADNSTLSERAPFQASKPEKKETAASLRIKVIDNGDGTRSFIVIPVEDNDSSQTDNSEDADVYAKEILELVNKERANAGLTAVELDSELCKAAQVRAEELGESYSHTRPDGSECFSVLKDYNISCVYAGENIVIGTSTSAEAMKLWMDSQGHRSNILRSGWQRLGVGYDSSTGGWVQIFTD